MSDLVINVKQISNYPAKDWSDGTETLLVQSNGLGGPYNSINAATLVATALRNGIQTLGVGVTPPPGADVASIYTENVVLPAGGELSFATALTSFSYQPQGYQWTVNDSVQMALDNAGNLSLPFGTLSVARDPAASNEVATYGWVSRNTVASFNNRIGQVQLNAADVYQALGLVDPIATQPWVIASINASIGNFLQTYPLVNSWNGRMGDVFLTLSDITCVFFQSGQQPISPTPISTSNDNSIATTQWVTSALADANSAVLVSSFNGRTGAVTLTLTDVTNVGAAPLNSPPFSGIPTAPTAVPGTSTAQLATTSFVQHAISSSTAGVASFNTRTGIVTLTTADVTAAGGLTNPNPNLTGIPTAPTATAGTATTQIATTQFVANAITAGTVASFNTRTGAVTLQLSDVTGVGGAPAASPNLTGTPTAPTASPGTNTTQIATTGFVTAALTAAGGVSSFNSRTGAVTLTTNDVSAVGGLVNPSVNLTGVPIAPTATPGTNTTQLATTQFVQAAVAAGVVSFNTRTGAITLVAADITGAGGALLASPSLTGTPTSPTAAPGTSNTQIASTAFVTAAIAASTSGVTSFNGRTGPVTLLLSDVTGVGGAPAASPALSGTPTGPTATAGTSTTQLATTQFVTSAVAAASVVATNLVNNSSFMVNQRSYTSGTALAANAFGHDRWKGGGSGGTYTFTQTTWDITITITAGSIMQAVEGGQTNATAFVLSWVGTANGRINAGAYGASPRTVTGIAVGANITIEFQSGTVSHVKLEAGSTPTAWVALPPADEMLNCQRFYSVVHVRWSGYLTAGWTYVALSNFPAAMRAAPTCAVLNNYSSAMGSLSFAIDQWSVGVAAVSSSTTGGGIDCTVSASADI